MRAFFDYMEIIKVMKGSNKFKETHLGEAHTCLIVLKKLKYHHGSKYIKKKGEIEGLTL